MNPVLALARPEIVDLQPYSHAAWLPALTRLHANEAPWRPPGDATTAGLNRYPEPQPKALVARLAALYGVPPGMLLVGRGSDEAIDLLSRIYLRAGRDAILQCPPTFGMYRVAAHIQGAAVVEVPLERERGWSLDPGRLLAAWRPAMKIVYLCSPNNPTANAFDLEAIEAVCSALDGKAIVAVDEAYVEWSGRRSLAAWLERFPTLAVLRTLSKAHALAGARIGALLAHPDLIELARRVIPPYSLAQPTIEAALRALEPGALADARARIETLLAERDYLHARLERSALVAKVWPSDTNFLLVDSEDADRFLRLSMAGGTLVRDLRANPALPGALRVSVGTRAENDALLQSLEAA
jgi:histidinol-phosphate aminotransferase